ncbi:hypothetical protein [Streptomyces sp. PA03-2a]|uniref:hypothetical protein n=1 Tax=Streptomyces sp. PA03-2a TaxID=3028701 RepID=UPI0029A5DA99|nr:hypothetical protein [Streptomyces sp. PA03-2a]MDX2732846.1 hypothetical protein [Streptomyces sp. PA03-2a]
MNAADLLHLIDRAERGSLLADEAQQLRDGIRALDAARRSAGGLQRSLLSARAERDELRAELDRVHLRACRTAESLRLAEAANARAALGEQQPTT